MKSMPRSSLPMTSEHKKVLFASSLGTAFEWYDFYLYGSLATIISKQFFSGVNDKTAFILTLMAFAAGFAVRPFGALVFGRLGDLVGRKHTFLVTILLMGLSTFVIGLLPSYSAIGVSAPIILVALRLLQGFALGGEYGGAATYVAEYAPNGRRGFFTSWIQMTATLGLLMSLLVILAVRSYLGEEDFAQWGWRIPFLGSIVLLGISIWIRMSLHESPVFQRMKDEGKTSKAPLKESFLAWANLKWVLVALFGLTAGQAVVWYTGQFYALFFLTQTLKVDAKTASLLMAIALFLALPLFVFMGSLSDRIGRKPIILFGCLLAASTYFPLFNGLTHYANPALEAAQKNAPIVVIANPADCSFQFTLLDAARFTSSCDIAKNYLSKSGINYTNQKGFGALAQIKVGEITIDSYDGSAPDAKKKRVLFTKQVALALKNAGYPLKANPDQINLTMVVIILFVLVLYVAMVYGPIAAILAEMFPTRIRYTSMSLPYHVGNGWFGGFLPTVTFALVATNGDIYNGLWYPIAIALCTVLIGIVFVRETKNVDIARDLND